jgi:hypothetical protein
MLIVGSLFGIIALTAGGVLLLCRALGTLDYNQRASEIAKMNLHAINKSAALGRPGKASVYPGWLRWRAKNK